MLLNRSKDTGNSSVSFYFTRFSVTLQEFSAFLCIKAVWGIEEKLGYELANLVESRADILTKANHPKHILNLWITSL